MNKKITCLLILLWAMVTVTQLVHSAEWEWNGYFGANYEDSTQVNSNGAFDAYIMSLQTKISLNDKIRFISQIDYEHSPFHDVSLKSDGSKTLDPRESGEIVVSRAYAQYNLNENMKIYVGKFFAPLGLYTQVYYALPAYPSLKIPRESIYKRGGSIAEDIYFFQRYLTGMWLQGDYGIQKWELKYDVFVSNGRTFTQHIDDNANKSVGGRVQLALPFAVKIEPLVSFYTDEFNVGTPAIPVWKSQKSIIPGLEINVDNLVVKSEFATTTLKNENGTKDKTMVAFYADVYYTYLDKYTPFVRYELFDPNKDSSNNQERETTIGLAYHLIPWMSQIKLQVRLHNSENSAVKDYQVYGAGVAIGF